MELRKSRAAAAYKQIIAVTAVVGDWPRYLAFCASAAAWTKARINEVSLARRQTGAYRRIGPSVIGTNVQPVGTRLPRLGRITVHFGQPLFFAATPGRNGNQARRAATDEIMAAIGRLSGQEQAQAYADLPA